MDNNLQPVVANNELANIEFKVGSELGVENRKPVDSKNLPLFNQFLQFAPDAMALHEVNTTKYMQVVANGTLIKARDGNGHLGMVMGNDGIKSHARLFDPDQLKKILTTSVAMRAVTMAVGQAHLAEISVQLKEINAKVAEIKQFLDDERSSKVEAINHYFDEYFLTANNGFALDSIRRSQIEQDGREIEAVLLHLTKEIQHAISKVENYKDESLFGSDSAFEALSNMLNNNLTILGKWFDIARVKAKGIQSLLLSNEYELFHQRKLSFLDQLEKFNSTEISSFRTVWLDRIAKLDAKLSSNKELAFKRNQLRTKLNSYLDLISNVMTQMNFTIQKLDEDANQVDVLLEVTDGKVVNAYLPEPDTEIITGLKNNFLKNLGKEDESFELVPVSFSDDILSEQKLMDDFKKEQQAEALKMSASETVESTKELVSEVGGKIGSMFKKIKW